ncbi:TIGR00366 family protein [Paracraurococcus lichenis]|uniref:TIGR00366 family protein n=1 Tax=Paracraurococcus lichenis TaxID=3064888 RepID=A0ABT9E7J1_9PROT|nr:TIGR00366 family protein [Paracraurococcus sp. LOR1-02]MDO9712153.1 TIGR00366 family protein [Paracraurococcus sp. LOR1-02]
MPQAPAIEARIAARSPLQKLVAFFVYLFERVMPDPFILAIALSVLTAGLAALLAPKGSLPVILTSWYGGIFSIAGFAFQMILVLVTGHSLASAPAVQAGLRRLVSLATTPSRAVALSFLAAALASWLNWGFGLIIGVLLAKEVARRVRVDFAWLVAAGYSGWVIWASGLSSSIALTQASHGNALNVIEKLTGRLTPLGETVFTTYNLVPTVLIVVIMPFVLMATRPSEADAVIVEAGRLGPDEAPEPATGRQAGFARRVEHSPVATAVFVAAGVAALGTAAVLGQLSFDINAVIFILLLAGLALHGRPMAYVGAVKRAAGLTGSMMLQYPIYGGIMGMMTATGLAERISEGFMTFATAKTFPFWSYIASLVITLFVPSGGGHWVVQGPFTVPAAVELHASVPASAMAVAMGEQVANMVQPFWVLPVVAIAGIGVQRVMGHTIITFLVCGVIYGIALLTLVPVG